MARLSCLKNLNTGQVYLVKKLKYRPGISVKNTENRLGIPVKTEKISGFLDTYPFLPWFTRWYSPWGAVPGIFNWQTSWNTGT